MIHSGGIVVLFQCENSLQYLKTDTVLKQVSDKTIPSQSDIDTERHD